MGVREQVILIGAFRETVELCEDAGLFVAGIFDHAHSGEFGQIPILGDDDTARDLAGRWSQFPAILTPDLPSVRQRLAGLYAQWGYRLRGVTSPHATISRSARVAPTAVLQAGAHVSSDTDIQDHARLNARCNVMHDCVVGAFATIAPNAVLLGRVIVGDGAYIGANATVLPGIKIAENAVVGAGAVVTRNVAAGEVVVGSPARPLRSNPATGAGP